MRSTAWAALVFAAAAACASQAQAAGSAADAALGRWLTPENAGVVEVDSCGSGLCGVVVTSNRIKADPTLKDTRNKDPVLRDRPIKGLALFQQMTGGPALWRGKVYNPVDGGTYAGSIRLVDATTLRLEGCIIWPLCKVQTWRRLP